MGISSAFAEAKAIFGQSLVDFRDGLLADVPNVEDVTLVPFDQITDRGDPLSTQGVVRSDDQMELSDIDLE